MTWLDKSTFAQKVIAAESTLFRVAKAILLRDKDCEDAVQNAILRSYEKLETLKNESYFKTWLVRILINECYSLKRTHFPMVSYQDYAETEPADSARDYSELYQALCELKPRIRLTIVLHYIEGYSVEEIKTMLKIPSGTVKSRLSKGRALLMAKPKAPFRTPTAAPRTRSFPLMRRWKRRSTPRPS